MENDQSKRNCDNGGYSYDTAVELTGHGCYNYIMLAACCVITLGVGLDMFGFSVAVAAASCDLNLTIPISGLLNSVPFAGLVSALPWGYYADTAGRRRALLLSTAVGFVFSVLSSFSPLWQVMLALKFIGYMFSTASFSIAMAYLGECVGSAKRGRYLFIMNSANVFGDFLYYFIAYFILPMKFSFPIPLLEITLRPWRIYLLVISAPLGIAAVMLLLLHESPKLLASRGKTKESLEVLTKMFERNGGKKNEYPVKFLIMDEVEDESKISFFSSVVKQTVPLFKPPLLWRTIQLYYLVAICSSTNNVFVMWYPIIVNFFFSSFSSGVVDDRTFCERIVTNMTISVDSGNHVCDDTISTNTIYAGMLLGLTFTTVNLAVSMVASYKRLLLLGIYLVSGLCLASVELIREPVTNLVTFTLVQCTVIGFSSISSYFVDLYPTIYRGMVASLGMMFGRLAALAGINVVGATIVNHCQLTFYSWTAYIASGILITMFLPSDSKQIK